MSHQDTDDHRDSHDQTIADDDNRAETNFSNDDINNNVIPDDNNNDAEELEINNNNNRFNESVAVTPDDVILTNRPPNPVPGPPLYLPQEPQVMQPPPPPMPGVCPCPAIYNDPGPSYYQLPPPDYQELSPANLPLQPNLPRYHYPLLRFAAAYSMKFLETVQCNTFNCSTILLQKTKRVPVISKIIDLLRPNFKKLCNVILFDKSRDSGTVSSLEIRL